MPLNTNKNIKLYYSIKEVAEMLGIPETTLRYWEKEFKELSPKKTNSGIRQYTEKDIKQIKYISFLVKDGGHTINGAKKLINKSAKVTVDTHEVVERLKAVRSELLAILDELNETPPCGQPF